MRKFNTLIMEAKLLPNVEKEIKKIYPDCKVEGHDKFFINQVLLTYKISDIDKNKIDIIWSINGDVKSVTYNKKTDDIISDDNNFDLNKDQTSIVAGFIVTVKDAFNAKSELDGETIRDLISK